MTQLQAANHGKGRPPHDLLETPEDVTRAVLPLLIDFGFPVHLWEPACGHGKIVRVLEANGYNVLASDVVDYGQPFRQDFLTCNDFKPDRAVVTNPPWALAHEFVVRCLDVPYVALLLKDTFWQPACRETLWRARRPALIAQLTWRPDWTGSKRPYFSAAWSIWTPHQIGETEYRRLARPE